MGIAALAYRFGVEAVGAGAGIGSIRCIEGVPLVSAPRLDRLNVELPVCPAFCAGPVERMAWRPHA